jgi:tetratricopeptide (TPR) repeat protein
LIFDPLYAKLLADVEMAAGRAESALDVVNETISEAEQTGQSWFDAELYRTRGELLLRCGRLETSASEAFKHAIDVARRQQTRAFELRAVLSLAQLYQSIGRLADAHAVLRPVLEGFSPTPEFPEIAEAQALVGVLAETDEVKNAGAALERRLKLQTNYGQALLWSKGFGTEETKAAFTRAQELAAKVSNADERFSTYYGTSVTAFMRGELGLARTAAENFRREAENGARVTEAAAARRILGMTCLFQGDFIAAEVHLQEY